MSYRNSANIYTKHRTESVRLRGWLAALHFLYSKLYLCQRLSHCLPAPNPLFYILLCNAGVDSANHTYALSAHSLWGFANQSNRRREGDKEEEEICSFLSPVAFLFLWTSPQPGFFTLAVAVDSRSKDWIWSRTCFLTPTCLRTPAAPRPQRSEYSSSVEPLLQTSKFLWLQLPYFVSPTLWMIVASCIAASEIPSCSSFHFLVKNSILISQIK